MLTAIGDVMRRCYERGWITTRDGNISLRRSLEGKVGSYLYITPSGFRKNIIYPENVMKLKFVEPEGELSWKSGKPSGELHMHWLLQRKIHSTRSVVHVHATHIVAAMYAGLKLQDLAKDFPEVFRYTRVGPNVPSLPATSVDLGEATAEALGVSPRSGELNFDIVGQDRHGVCAVGKHPWDAYEHIERLNHVCEIVLASGGARITKDVAPKERNVVSDIDLWTLGL